MGSRDPAAEDEVSACRGYCAQAFYSGRVLLVAPVA